MTLSVPISYLLSTLSRISIISTLTSYLSGLLSFSKRGKGERLSRNSFYIVLCTLNPSMNVSIGKHILMCSPGLDYNTCLYLLSFIKCSLYNSRKSPIMNWSEIGNVTYCEGLPLRWARDWPELYT